MYLDGDLPEEAIQQEMRLAVSCYLFPCPAAGAGLGRLGQAVEPGLSLLGLPLHEACLHNSVNMSAHPDGPRFQKAGQHPSAPCRIRRGTAWQGNRLRC